MTIGNIIAIGSLLVAIICLVRTMVKDNNDSGKEVASTLLALSIKIDSILTTVADIKTEMKDTKKSIDGLEKDVVALQEQMKVANHRIDDLENK